MGFEPTPFQTSALNWRLRPLGQLTITRGPTPHSYKNDTTINSKHKHHQKQTHNTTPFHHSPRHSSTHILTRLVLLIKTPSTSNSNPHTHIIQNLVVWLLSRHKVQLKTPARLTCTRLSHHCCLMMTLQTLCFCEPHAEPRANLRKGLVSYLVSVFLASSPHPTLVVQPECWKRESSLGDKAG